MRILLTRPDGDNDDLGTRLIAAGIAVTTAPLLAEVAVPANLPAEGEFAGVIVTSRRAVAAATPDMLELPLYAVGEATAAVARDAGFRTIIVADATGKSLAQRILAEAPTGPLLYLAARDRSPDLEAGLAEGGVTLAVRVVYAMDAVTALSPDVEQALRDGEIAAAAFYSRRTAETFARLTAGRAFDSMRASLVCLCISRASTEPLAASGFARTRTSAHPDGAATDALVMDFAMAGAGAR